MSTLAVVIGLIAGAVIWLTVQVGALVKRVEKLEGDADG